jgi:formylglycine-generating enzyme required for sulfatase activity
MTFCRVPAGEFVMGKSGSNAEVSDDQKPQHTLDLGYDYWVGRFTVTNMQYAALNIFSHPVENWQNKKDFPVVSVSWDDALNYCAWYNREYADHLPMGLQVALPSEAEWEMAARGTDGRRHPWGETAPVRDLCNIDQWYQGITPVGQFSPGGDSPFGCADMAGNVWEWTRSLFKRYPYNPGWSGRPENCCPKGAARGFVA